MRSRKFINVTVWTVQVLPALFMPIPLGHWFVLFIGGLAGYVAYARLRLVPLPSSRQETLVYVK